MERPSIYLPCYGVTDTNEVTDVQRRFFTVLRLRHAEFLYEFDMATEQELRTEVLGGIFETAVGRNFWKSSGNHWQTSKLHNAKVRAFTGMIDDEYRKAVAAGPPLIPLGFNLPIRVGDDA